MQIASAQFTPSRLPTVLVLCILLPLFIGLGIWQLDRAKQKERRSTNQTKNAALPAIFLDQTVSLPLDIVERKVIAEGIYQHEKEILIANRNTAVKTASMCSHHSK